MVIGGPGYGYGYGYGGAGYAGPGYTDIGVGPGLGARYYCADIGVFNANPFRSDEDIRKEIELTLVWDTWVNYDEIRIEVRNGVATLDGEVDSITAKRSAGDDTWDTVGVIDVVNNIKIRVPEALPAAAGAAAGAAY